MAMPTVHQARDLDVLGVGKTVSFWLVTWSCDELEIALGLHPPEEWGDLL